MAASTKADHATISRVWEWQQIASIVQANQAQQTSKYDDSVHEKAKTLADGVTKSGAQASFIDLEDDENEYTTSLGAAAGSLRPSEDLI